MMMRSLGPWILFGALLASSYANLSWYRGQKAEHEIKAPASQTDSVRSFHLAPGNSGNPCPTLELLELSEEQRKQIRSCSLTSLELRTRLAREIDESSAQLQELLSQYPADKQEVLQLADRISAMRSKQFKSWVGSILVVRDVLTPEQTKRLRSLDSN